MMETHCCQLPWMLQLLPKYHHYYRRHLPVFHHYYRPWCNITCPSTTITTTHGCYSSCPSTHLPPLVRILTSNSPCTNDSVHLYSSTTEYDRGKQAERRIFAKRTWVTPKLPKAKSGGSAGRNRNCPSSNCFVHFCSTTEYDRSLNTFGIKTNFIWLKCFW